MIERILTIGAYGFDAASFAGALRSARVDLFIDIRARRGVRGAEYSFGNAARLQAALARAGIRYVHAKNLAPSAKAREAQYAVDAAAKVAKRQRSRLSGPFVEAYSAEVLSGLDPHAFLATHCNGAKRPVLFCVEREPEACHRSLLARKLGTALGVPVEDLRP